MSFILTSVSFSVREAEEKLMLPPAPGAVPLLSLYLEEEAVIYGDDFEVITAAEAGWPEHAEKTDAEMLRRDKSWMKTACMTILSLYVPAKSHMSN